MDLHYKREATVGALVIAGIAFFVLGTMWLGGKDFSGADHTMARFSDVGNLKKASPVTVSGVPVGKVEEVVLRGVGDVAVYMTLPGTIPLKADARAEIVSVGLVGDQAIRLLPGSAAEPLPAGAEIPGTIASGFADLGADLGARAGRVLEGAERFTAEENVVLLRQTLTSIERLTRTLADPKFAPTAELTQTLEALRRVLERTDRALADSTTRRTLARLDSVTASFDTLARQAASASSRLDTLLANVNAGRGTLGKFAADSGLYQDLRETNRSLQELLRSLAKEPGRLNVEVKMF
jgi:phospholipid/cholesterol/gamma-HCH transport system substrate-binding protein